MITTVSKLKLFKMKHKISCLIVCLALFGMSEQVTSQTYIIPEVGLNIHTLKFDKIYYDNGHYPLENIKNIFDYGIGLKMKHQLSTKWAINLNGNYYLRKHSFIEISEGFEPYKITNSYRMINIDLSVSFEIIKNFELAMGYKYLFLYSQSIKINKGEPKSEANAQYNSFLFDLTYILNNFVIDLSYSNSIKKSDSIGIEIFSLNVGYRIKLFDSFKRGQKVNCPKF